MTTDVPTKLGEQHSPLTQLVTQTLRRRIIGGEFPPGFRLVEGRLSDELGVSRMPVREALRALAAEGIVTIEPRKGASVIRFSPEQVMEMIEVRATLEALNAKLAAKRHDPTQIAKLQGILEKGAQLTENDDLERMDELNVAFHEALGHIGANSVLQEIMRSLRERTALLFIPSNRHRIRDNWTEHARILRAVIDGDAELASLLASRHVYNAAQDLPGALKIVHDHVA